MPVDLICFLIFIKFLDFIKPLAYPSGEKGVFYVFEWFLPAYAASSMGGGGGQHPVASSKKRLAKVKPQKTERLNPALFTFGQCR
jgi:hypothetical protein